MRNPLLDPNAQIVIAHRGNRTRAPENTIESFQEAVDLGADAIEFDVRVTRDGVPVVIHDAEVDRTTNGRGPVASFALAELQTLDAGLRVPRFASARVRVPSLEEVLDRFRDIPVVIEVKVLAAAQATEAMIRRFAAQDRAVVGSADALVMERFYRSDLRRCASMADATRLIPLAIVGLTPARPRYDVLSITPRFRGVPVPVTRMANAARKVGVPTQVWTVNDVNQATRYWNNGVAGIVTDDPAAMLRARSG